LTEIAAASGLDTAENPFGNFENRGQKDSSAVPVPDTAQPPCTGSLRVYIPRGSIGEPFSTFVNAYPFCEKMRNDSLAGYLVVEKATPSAITLKLSGRVVNGAGQALSALDFVNLWTMFVKEHPAEGLALFRRCDGIVDFIKGREALIPGLQVPDDKTIRIRLSAPDPSAIDRLRTARALPAGFKLGAYFQKVTRGTENVLSSNRSAAGNRPFLNECLVRTGGDNNPLVSYSLGRYDAMVLSNSADLEYALRNLLKDGTCSIVSRDRYFIATNIGDSSARAYIRSMVSEGELLKKFVKAEGVPIQRLESDSLSDETRAVQPMAKPTFDEPLKIVYRKDDVISKIIAERLLAGLTGSGIPGAVVAADEKSYESALVTRNFTCAVGWVPSAVMTDESEKLRLASLYFNDETNEKSRIASCREIPLFSIDWYLLAKSSVGLHKGKVSGMYVKQLNK
jgi:hypothetical protein